MTFRLSYIKLLSALLCYCLIISTCALQADEPVTVIEKQVLVTLIEQIEVPAQEAGLLRELAVREGEKVHKGMRLGQLDNREAKLNLDRAQIDLDIARQKASNDVKVRYAVKSYEVVQKEYERSLESNKKFATSISKTELDRQRLAVEQAKLEIEQAEKEFETARLELNSRKNALEQAKYALSKRDILSPLEGEVVQISRRAGEWTKPGETVLKIVRLDRLRLEGFVNSKEAKKFLPGTEVQVQFDVQNKAGKTFTGAIVFVHPDANPVDGQIRFWAEIENRNNLLRPGLRGTLRVEPASK